MCALSGDEVPDGVESVVFDAEGSVTFDPPGFDVTSCGLTAGSGATGGSCQCVPCGPSQINAMCTVGGQTIFDTNGCKNLATLL